MIFKVKRTDLGDYDEYDEVVVRAASAADALKMVCQTNEYGEPKFSGFRPDGSNVLVTRVSSTGPPMIISYSFHAG